MLRNQEDAHDAVHDAVIRAWKRRGDLRSPDQFGRWFDAIVLNVCRDRLRRSRQVRFVPLTDTTPGSLGADPESSAVIRDELNRSFARMPFDLRAVVVLRFWGDLTVAEIAARLHIPEGTVKSRLHASMVDLRAAVDGQRRAEADT
jgi:RNA polymerase sigma-70 factor, ECF subfamily